MFFLGFSESLFNNFLFIVGSVFADGLCINCISCVEWRSKFLGMVACGVHIYGFLDDEEPFPHEMFFCGTYFAFTLVAIFGMIIICISIEIPLIVDAIITVCAAALYIIGSIVSMYHAENDFHLMYLSDMEESDHKFFFMCKTQSIVSLVAGLTYMLHATFAIDALVINPTESQLNLLQVSPADRAASAKLELVLFCKPWFAWMNRCQKEDDSNA